VCNIAIWSTALKQFSKWDFHGLCNSDNLHRREAFKKLLLKLRIFYERYPKKFFRTTRMAMYIHRICEELRTTYLPRYSMEELTKQGNEWYSSIGRPAFGALIAFMRDHYRLKSQSAIEFNHWNLPTQVTLTEKNGKAPFAPRGEE
jgi:hypothetical protein